MRSCRPCLRGVSGGTVCAPYALGVSDAYYDLGDYHRPVMTTSPAAQVWFDRGLVWAYAFNHDEAVTCFAGQLEL